MSLFKEHCIMLSELDRLERLIPTHKDLLIKLSKIIRNQVWGVSQENNLAVFLNRANWIFTIVIDAIGETFLLVDMYIDLLCKQSKYFTSHDISGYLGMLKKTYQY